MAGEASAEEGVQEAEAKAKRKRSPSVRFSGAEWWCSGSWAELVWAVCHLCCEEQWYKHVARLLCEAGNEITTIPPHLSLLLAVSSIVAAGKTSP